VVSSKQILPFLTEINSVKAEAIKIEVIYRKGCKIYGCGPLERRMLSYSILAEEKPKKSIALATLRKML